MAQYPWPEWVAWPYLANTGQKNNSVICLEVKELEVFSEDKNDYIRS